MRGDLSGCTSRWCGPILAYLILGGPVPTFMVVDDLGATYRQAGEALLQMRKAGLVRMAYGPGGTHVPATADVPAELPWGDDL